MKKFMALCLTIIMVISMFTVAVSAAAITVPASTLVNQSFEGLSAIPSGWTVTRGYYGGSSQYGDTYSFEADGIQVLNNTKESGLTMRKDEAFDAGAAPYTFSVTLNNYTGVNVVHFGADTLAQATQPASDGDWLAGVADTGYTFIARTGFTATGGTDYQYGGYYLYTSDENGEPKQLMQIADKNATWLSGKAARKFEFIVTDEGITGNIWKPDGSAIESTASYTFEDGEVADKAGYVGINLVNNNANATESVSRLKQISVVANEFSYDVTTPADTTGGYIVTGQEYVQQHVGTMYVDQSFGGWSANTIPSGITVGQIGTYSDTDVKFVDYQNGYVNLGTKSVDGSFVAEAKYSAFPYANSAYFDFYGYKFVGNGTGSNYSKKSYVLLQGSTVLAEVAKTETGATQNVIKAVFTKGTEDADGDGSIDGAITVYVNNNVLFENVKVAVPTYSGTLRIGSNYSASISASYVKVYTPDYADTSYYRDITKSNFLLNKSFANADAEELAALGFTVSGTGIGANGIYKTDGQASVTYNTKFGGSYTIETYCDGNYNNPETITFNKTADGDSYVLKTEGNSYSLTRNVGGVATELVKETFDAKGSPYYVFARRHKIVITANEDGTKDIDVYLGSNQILTVTDEAPITAAGTIAVKTGYNSTSNIHDLKVYPGTTVPVYTGNFLVNGTATADKGDTVFTFPTVMLGQSVEVIAALYEDGKMADIKMVDMDTLNNEGYAQLFNTTQSKASEVNVKVFIWDSLAGMTPVTNAFALNK